MRPGHTLPLPSDVSAAHRARAAPDGPGAQKRTRNEAAGQPTGRCRGRGSRRPAAVDEATRAAAQDAAVGKVAGQPAGRCRGREPRGIRPVADVDETAGAASGCPSGHAELKVWISAIPPLTLTYLPCILG